MSAVRVHRVPFSTNVERVALAAAHKGIAVEWIDHPGDDRSGIERVSGQSLAPVAELGGGEVVADSPAIILRLEERWPDRPLWPSDPARAAEADVFVAWFNRVWKVAPNAIAEAVEPGSPELDPQRRELRESRETFERLLTGRAYLLGDDLGIADIIAYPFLRYALGCGPGDDHRFHRALAEHLALEPRHRELAGWLARMAQRPQA